jgi:predicted nuclease with RNAse H fold
MGTPNDSGVGRNRGFLPQVLRKLVVIQAMPPSAKPLPKTMDSPCMLGIDVGGPSKGFHAVAMGADHMVEPRHFDDVAALRDWALELQPAAIAIDAPCDWSSDGRSRQAERELCIGDEKISCFSTPTEAIAGDRSFYAWVHHGLKLYRTLEKHFPLYRDSVDPAPKIIETFPHAVACALAGKRLSAKHKSSVRRRVLKDLGIPEQDLPNIDFVDAALCAVAARSWHMDEYQAFGNPAEGFIVIPSSLSIANPNAPIDEVLIRPKMEVKPFQGHHEGHCGFGHIAPGNDANPG